MAGRPKRLYGPAALTGSAATKYTVPAGVRALIRHIHISNTSAGVITVTVSLGADAAGTRLFDAYSIAAGAVMDWYPYEVLEAAEIIQAWQVSGGTTGVITINGDESLV